jgi:hypothetical protein
MRNTTDYQAFQTKLAAILDAAKDIDDDQLCEQMVNYLDEQMQPWGGINRDYASRTFQRCLQHHGRDTIADCVLEWAEEVANGIRWPVAFTYIVTGKLPGEYRENTTVVIVVEDRQGKVVGHQVINWCDYAHVENDTECYTALNKAIDNAAVDLPRARIQVTSSANAVSGRQSGTALALVNLLADPPLNRPDTFFAYHKTFVDFEIPDPCDE